MSNFRTFFACVLFALTLLSGQAVHASPIAGCAGVVACATADLAEDEEGQVPAGDHKAVHCHGLCHAHSLGSLTPAPGLVLVEVRNLPSPRIATDFLTTVVSDPALRPPIA